MGTSNRESTISLSAPSIHELYGPDKRISAYKYIANKKSRVPLEEKKDPPITTTLPRKPSSSPSPRKERKGRTCVSADNSPILTRQIRSQVEKKNLHTKLLIPNMDKFDIEIACPDGEIFKADIFKVWTASQLSWKIAHVKGMVEKLALLVQEYITQLHLVRPIEDHECVYDVIQNWAPGSYNALKMVEDYTKFDLFYEPADYLPSDLLDVGYLDMLQKGTDSTKHNLSSFIVKADTSVDVCHWVFIKDFDKKTWKRTYLRIKDSILHFCENEKKDPTEWNVLYHCKDSYLYHCLDEFNTAHKPPYSYCFCIIPSVVNKWQQIKCFSVESRTMFNGWLTAFRLAKYGQQLFKNFCEAMTKEETLRRTNSSHQTVLSRGHRSSEVENLIDIRAAVDFSGNNARVISDPRERIKMQNQLGFEIPRPVKRRSETFSPMAFRRAVLSNKVWYHGMVKREQAILKLKKNGLKDGMFLVRESSTCQGNLVLSVVRKDRIVHHQIFQKSAPDGKMMYGMQHGPQFTSLEQFIEAHNSGTVEDFILRKPCPPT